MPRWEHPLSQEALTLILEYAGVLSAADIARRLGPAYNYFTVAKAVHRVKAGRLVCPLTWVPCTECGGPIAGPRGRTVHPACERARAVRRARERRRRRPGQSTPYVARYRQEHPEAARALREQDKARMRALWPSLPEAVREASLAKAHAADSRDYPLTHATADRSHRKALWTEDEDAVIRASLQRPARDVALELGRTLWAVRNRRVRLRRLVEQEAAAPAPAVSPISRQTCFRCGAQL